MARGAYAIAGIFLVPVLVSMVPAASAIDQCARYSYRGVCMTTYSQGDMTCAGERWEGRAVQVVVYGGTFARGFAMSPYYCRDGERVVDLWKVRWYENDREDHCAIYVVTGPGTYETLACPPVSIPVVGPQPGLP